MLEQQRTDEHGGDRYRNPAVRLDFSVNLNPCGPEACVRQAAEDALDRIAQYPDTRREALISAIAGSEGFDRDMIIPGNGADELIYALAHALLLRKMIQSGTCGGDARGDEVQGDDACGGQRIRALIPVPAFMEYEAAMRAVGAECRFFQMSASVGFALDESFVSEINKETDVVFLCQPNNPTGRLAGEELCGKLLEKCRQTGTILFADESFLEFAGEPERLSFKGMIRRGDPVVILRSLTKEFAIPGLRIGFAAVPDGILAEQMKIQLQPWNISVVGEAAAIAAMKEKTSASSGRIRELIKAEREYLFEGLEECGFRVYPSDANYILFAGKTGLKEELLKEGILIRDCSGIRGLERGFYRTAVRLHEENTELIRAVGKITGSDA